MLGRYPLLSYACVAVTQVVVWRGRGGNEEFKGVRLCVEAGSFNRLGRPGSITSAARCSKSAQTAMPFYGSGRRTKGWGKRCSTRSPGLFSTIGALQKRRKNRASCCSWAIARHSRRRRMLFGHDGLAVEAAGHVGVGFARFVALRVLFRRVVWR